MEDWLVFSFWKEKNEGVSQLSSPFQDMAITGKTVFLWSEITAPLPSGAAGGEWGWFPEPKALAGYLRFHMLPVYFETWLVREDWDTKGEDFISAEELFSRAVDSNRCWYTKDIPLMRSLIEQLDDLLRRGDDSAVMSGLERVAEAFNGKFEHTATWQFKIEVYADPVSVGKEIYRRTTEDEEDEDEVFAESFEMNKAEWLDVCSRTTVDTAAQERFLQVLDASCLV